MDLSKILSIAGKPGLFKLVGEAKNNIVVESLTDGKRGPAFSHERISTLEEISIYTESGDVPLKDVLKNINEKQDGKPITGLKKLSSNDLKKLFVEVLPDYDQEAVYVSDIKKVFNWYNFLLERDMLDFTEEETETTGTTDKEDADSKVADDGPNEKAEPGESDNKE